jgi:hypothetical protein
MLASGRWPRSTLRNFTRRRRRNGEARAEWPEQMKREVQACGMPEQQRLWAEKWALQFGGARGV